MDLMAPFLFCYFLCGLGLLKRPEMIRTPDYEEASRNRHTSIQFDPLSLPLYTSSPTPPSSGGTCNAPRAELMHVAPDAQLAFAVGAPALDPAPGSDRARVVQPSGDGDGRDACVVDDGCAG
jgi:hypothetical protein